MTDREFDMDEWMDELEDRVEEAVQNAAENVVDDLLEDRLEEAVFDAVQQAMPEILGESLARFEFQLKDGTIVRPREQTKVLSPDKSKLLLCYGGLRVDGKSLIVQTRLSCWEWIADYPDREAAIAALNRLRLAIEAGEKLVEL
jgi:hypothetical protein